MRKTFLSVIALLCMVSTETLLAQNTTTPANPNAPEIKFATLKHDFGNIKEGEKAVFEFEFTNTGHEPLIIQSAQPSCSCTASHVPKEPVLPGKSEKITAEYGTQGRVGAFTKTINVSSNANTPSVVLTITGNVQAATVTPSLDKNQNTVGEQKK